MRRLVLAALVLFAPACVQTAAADRHVIEIDIEHSAFRPSRLEIARGTTVTFVIRNGDPIDHEFILGDRAVQLRHERGTEAHHGVKPGEVSVGSGETVTTTYTFEETGTLIMGCHLPGHYDYGMRGAVEVR